MTLEKLATEYSTTLSGNGGSISSGATTFDVADALPSGFAVPFRACISAAGATTGEIVLVTAVSTLAWTVTRGQETTLGAPAAAGHNDGDSVAAVLTAAGLIKILADATAPSTQNYGDAAASGSGPGLANVDHKHGFPAAPAGGLGVYGDGSDGTRTFDGSTTILGMAPSSNVYTLTRDIFLAAGTLNSGVAIVTNGFRLFCSGTLTNNGTIRHNGVAGVTGSPAGTGAGNASGSIISSATFSGQGGNGSVSNGTNGSAPAAASALGGSGGAGGIGGTGTAGNGGTAVAPTAAKGTLREVPQAVVGSFVGLGVITLVGGAGGGGGGGGDGSNSGGYGGGGGGFVLLSVKTFAGTGAIQARGGAGSNGDSFGNTGGAGGGGGGVVVVTSTSVVSGSPNTIAGQTIDANGGALGAHFGTGADGHAGSAGTVILVPN